MLLHGMAHLSATAQCIRHRVPLLTHRSPLLCASRRAMPQLLHSSAAQQPAHARRGRCALLVARAAADDSAADEEEETEGEEEEEEFEGDLDLAEASAEDTLAGGLGVWKPKRERDRFDPMQVAYMAGVEGDLEQGVTPEQAAAAERERLEGASRHAAAAALLRDLPGIKAEADLQEWVQRVVRNDDNWSEEGDPLHGAMTTLYDRENEAAHDIVAPSAPLHSGQVPLDEWELRAMMEKRRAKEKANADWMQRRAEVGRYPRIAADWRSDVRIKDTGDPTAPEYREWTHKEIWDLITMGGKAADPRIVQVEVRDPKGMADAVAEGAKYVPETEEFMAEVGMLIDPEDEQFIIDKQTEEALLASEFTDFDEEYLTSGFSDGAASFDELDTSDNF